MKNIVLIVMLLVSCSSENESQDSLDNFYALTVGNSWEYKWYTISEESQNMFYNGITDSVSIVGTEIINNEVYYKFRSLISGNNHEDNEDIPISDHFPVSGEYFSFYRDSLGYLIDDLGKIYFINNNYDEYLSYTRTDFIDNELVEFREYFKLVEGNTIFSVEAGIFDCLEMDIYYLYGEDQMGPAINDVYYSDGIGLISKDELYLSCTYCGHQKRLDSYNIN